MWTKKRVADLLFWVQMICGLIFCIGQFVRMLTNAEGVNVSWFLSWEAFLLLNLGLAISAHREQASRITRQTIVSYTVWTIMVAANAGVMFWKGGAATWDHRDTITMVLVGIGAVLAVGYGCTKGLGILGSINDPIVKGLLALALKIIPQLALAWKMHEVGGAGLALLTVANGHIAIGTRLGQLVFSIKEAGWDRNRIGSAISEAGNEFSWIVVTIVWAYKTI